MVGGFVERFLLIQLEIYPQILSATAVERLRLLKLLLETNSCAKVIHLTSFDLTLKILVCRH